MIRPTLISVLAISSLGFAAPASAQSAGEKVNQLIIYGDDACPPSVGDEIIVCARKDEGERFRIPAPLRENFSPANESWNNRVLAYETVGAAGTQSCSPTGAGGWTGCAARLIDAAYAEKKIDPQIRFAELIAAERARRLSTVDTDAAAEQARVEVIEREYDARLHAESEASVPADAVPPPAPASATVPAPRPK